MTRRVTFITMIGILRHQNMNVPMVISGQRAQVVRVGVDGEKRRVNKVHLQGILSMI
jgi:hypothetical protein